MSVNKYHEDAWTTRLFYGLRNGIKEFNGKLYAHLRGRCTSLGGGTLPIGVTNDGFIFKGSPDFISKSIPINVSHSLGDDDDSDGDASSDMSGESVKVEHAHQLPPNSPYKHI